MGLDLKDDDLALPDVEDAGVLAGSLDDVAALGRQLLEVDARALVAAVFGPHDREDAQLGQVGLLADEFDDEPVLVLGEAVLIEKGLIDHGGPSFRRPPGDRPASAFPD